MKTVRAARKAGYAAGRVHGVDSAIALGVPIQDPQTVAVAGLSVAAITTRMTTSRQLAFLRILRTHARKMAERLQLANLVDRG